MAFFDYGAAAELFPSRQRTRTLGLLNLDLAQRTDQQISNGIDLSPKVGMVLFYQIDISPEHHNRLLQSVHAFNSSFTSLSRQSSPSPFAVSSHLSCRCRSAILSCASTYRVATVQRWFSGIRLRSNPPPCNRCSSRSVNNCLSRRSSFDSFSQIDISEMPPGIRLPELHPETAARSHTTRFVA